MASEAVQQALGQFSRKKAGGSPAQRDLELRELQRLQRFSAIGLLAAEIAHEVRNPLVALRTLLEASGDQKPSKGLEERIRKLGIDELGRMDRLLHGLLGTHPATAGSVLRVTAPPVKKFWNRLLSYLPIVQN